MFLRFFSSHGRVCLATIVLVANFLGTLPALIAADPAPVVGPGATREEVINAYGWPSGFSQSGSKEILTYPQGRITLENGRVEKMDFLPNVPWPAPRARPRPPTATTAKKPDAFPDYWLEHFEDAQKEALRRNARILAAFTGSDWSPPSRQFLEEVAFHPDFVNSFTGDFVFLRLDFPTRTAQPPEIRDQNVRLRAAYGVTTYPALLVLSPAGEAVATVDLTKPRPGESYLARVIAAIGEVRDLLKAQPLPPVPVSEPVTRPTKSAPRNFAVVSSVTRSFTLVMGAIVGGLLLAGLGWWFLWRARLDDPANRTKQMRDRISDAASGLPSPTEVEQWPKEKLVNVVRRLAESEGYETKPRSGKGDGDLALFRAGQTTPHVIVSCQAGSAGSAAAKRVRELFGVITVEGVKTGWFVSPLGFSREARDYATEHALVLIDTEHLLAQMRAVPVTSLHRILAG